jgi:cell division protein FtsN
MPRVVSNARVEPESESSPAQRQSEPRAAPPVRHVAAPAPSNAPLSLSPDASDTTATAPAARAPTRTAAVAAPPPTAVARTAPSATGNFAVQVSSQRSEAEAQAAFRSLQAKYPDQLSGREALIRRVELGAKGTYYRAMVGPFASADEANALCNNLKAAGGQCLIQRN